jgi:hypothetical protein
VPLKNAFALKPELVSKCVRLIVGVSGQVVGGMITITGVRVLPIDCNCDPPEGMLLNGMLENKYV